MKSVNRDAMSNRTTEDEAAKPGSPRDRRSPAERAAAHGPVVAQPHASGPAVVISRRASDKLRAGHVWVYRSDVEKLIPALSASPEAARPGATPSGAAEIEDLPSGALVAVLDNRGIPLGAGTYSSASQIAVRLFSTDAKLTRAGLLRLVRERTAAAIDLRTEILAAAEDTDACRLIFSEADGLPGIMVDRYGELVILQLLTQGMAAEDVRNALVDALREKLAASGLPSLTIWERPDPRIRELEQLAAASSDPLFTSDKDSPVASTLFKLNGLRFHYDVNSGQKTGAFLDQRENYATAARHAASSRLGSGGEALDICTYQGGFALHLARVCRRVTGVDASRAALEMAERNLELNSAQLVDGGAGVDWIEANAFELLRDYEASGQRFDTIVLDPPAFAKTKRATEGAIRGYKEMNLRALKMLRPGGLLVTCSCSHHISLAEFTEVVAAASSDAHTSVRLVETRGASLDHPAILSLPETSYLKCLICRVA